jgi:hypothetical protein
MSIPKRITVNLVPGEAYYRDAYGIVLKSETEHVFAGRGIHNNGLGHVLQVWDNSVRPSQDGSGQLVDPSGNATSERYSYLWSAQASVIALHPQARDPRGESLTLGDLVVLQISGYEIGEFQCRARSLHNPHMVKVDTSSSASRQHYIDTGEYLAVEE